MPLEQIFKKLSCSSRLILKLFPCLSPSKGCCQFVYLSTGLLQGRAFQKKHQPSTSNFDALITLGSMMEDDMVNKYEPPCARQVSQHDQVSGHGRR